MMATLTSIRSSFCVGFRRCFCSRCLSLLPPLSDGLSEPARRSSSVLLLARRTARHLAVPPGYRDAPRRFALLAGEGPGGGWRSGGLGRTARRTGRHGDAYHCLLGLLSRLLVLLLVAVRSPLSCVTSAACHRAQFQPRRHWEVVTIAALQRAAFEHFQQLRVLRGGLRLGSQDYRIGFSRSAGATGATGADGAAGARLGRSTSQVWGA